MIKCWRRVSMPLSLAAAAVLMAACGPEKRVQWSPDGAAAAIVSDGNLYLCDATGKLSGPLAGRVGRFGWMPDSRRLAVVLTEEVDSWEELVRLAPLELDQKRITAAVGMARNELLAFEGNLDDFKPANAGQLTMQQWVAGILFLKQSSDAGLREKLGEEWKEIAEAKAELHTIGILPVSPAGGSLLTLFRTLNEIDEVRVSPDGGALTLATSWNVGWAEAEDSSLLVAPSSVPAKPRVVAEHVARFPDWTSDGRSLAFFRHNPPDPSGLGRLTLRAVRDADGAFPAELPEARDVATALFDRNLRVRCLRDGRLIFAAPEVSLPAGIAEFSRRTALFSLDPAGAPAVSRLLPREVADRLPNRADLFELSPDETRVVIPDSKGRVCVATLATGELTEVLPRDGSDDLRTVPVWRSDGGLSFLAPAGSSGASGGRPELVVWTPARAIAVSVTWRDEVLAGIK